MVIADDHAIVRQAMARILSQIAGAYVVAEASHGLEAIAAARRHKPSLLVLDAAMPLAKGVEVFAEVRRWCPETRVVTCTGFTSHTLLAEWVELGADGLLLKSCDPDEIRRCFEVVLAGHKFVAAEVRRLLQEATERRTLSVREREVLSLIATGHSSHAIAERLHISIKTVEKHRASLMTKVGAGSVAELLSYALREGYLDAHRQL